MTEVNHLDERGRLTIRAEYRRVLGGRVVQILTPHGVLIRPVPDKLPDEGRLPSAYSTSGEDEGLAEAGERLRRVRKGR